MCNKMSDVRLSNASPTVERVDARQPDNVRPSVRRNLFGRPDPEQLRRDVTASIQEDVQRVMDEYNFDPVNERPLTPRNYDWQVDHGAPEFFRRQPHGSQRPRRDVDLPDDNTSQDAEERSDRQSGRQPDRRGSRKRRSGTSGNFTYLMLSRIFFFPHRAAMLRREATVSSVRGFNRRLRSVHHAVFANKHKCAGARHSRGNKLRTSLHM